MRLLIVSNRLPVTAVLQDGEVIFQPSPGGLATGLSNYLQSPGHPDYLWIGWPGGTFPDDVNSTIREKARQEHCAHPVFLSEEDMEKFYHGFCNKTIWALFHCFPEYAAFEEQYWEHYRRVSEIFCKAICEVARPGDVIWVHDYHLMLLPRLLREALPENPIGFFLHIPFPPFEIFRILPVRWRVGILEGLLGADVIGFHTHDYMQYFLRCVLRLLGYEHNMGEFLLKDRVVKVDTFPMGIDYTRFHEGAGTAEVIQEAEKLKSTLDGERVILSMDRLDYSKGIAQRLRGFEYFLETNPEWQGKVVLLLVVVPSRIGVDQYQQLKKQIDELTGRINGRFGRIHWNPILYQYRSLDFVPMAALYKISDVILVTPLRDGMNLIAKEYVASRSDGTGVLILSEMTGAARELGEAVLMNPNTVEEIAESLNLALQMPVEEQKRRNIPMQQRLRRNDVARWAGDFLQAVHDLKERQKKFEARMLAGSARELLLKDFRNARNPIVALDYDGTLVPFARHPDLAAPDSEVTKLLLALAKRAEVVVASGRDRAALDRWFGSAPFHFVAEHGIWIRRKNDEWKAVKSFSNAWKAQVLPVFEAYTDRLPGAFLEEKEYSIAYHFRLAEQEHASIRVRELTNHLMQMTSNVDVQVLPGNKVLEMRSSGVNKGHALLNLLAGADYDFILAAGDDLTDEDLFRELPPSAYSIKVGMFASRARFNLRGPTDVRTLIQDLLST